MLWAGGAQGYGAASVATLPGAVCLISLIDIARRSVRAFVYDIALPCLPPWLDRRVTLSPTLGQRIISPHSRFKVAVIK